MIIVVIIYVYKYIYIYINLVYYLFQTCNALYHIFNLSTISTHPSISKKSLLTTGAGKPPRRQEVWRPSSTTRGIWCIKRVATSGALPLRQILWISWWTGPAEGAVTMGNAGRFWRSKYGNPKSVVQAGKDILDEMSKFRSLAICILSTAWHAMNTSNHPKHFLRSYGWVHREKYHDPRWQHCEWDLEGWPVNFIFGIPTLKYTLWIWRFAESWGYP